MVRVRNILAAVVVGLMASAAQAVKIADITRLSGERSNVLVGYGLVVGLKGTGDGGDFAPAIRPLREMLAKLNNNATLPDLSKVQNVALVSVSAVVPPRGARLGDRLDVRIAALGTSPSLRGGQLFVTPLQAPVAGGEIFALASGPVTLDDASTPTSALVVGGAVMEADLPMQVIENGSINLIIEEPAASWTTASTMAKIINDAEGTGETLAVAVDAKNVIVSIPASERQRPDSFISRIQQLPVRMMNTEARVVINEREGTIIITGDVEISPVVISHKGLTISTITPAPVPSARNPVVIDRQAIALDTTNQGGAKLQELVDALDLIKVPAADRITIVKELYKTGRLHAKLIVNGHVE